MGILKIAAGCAAIASGIAGFAGHSTKAALFALCAVVLMCGRLWKSRKSNE